MGGGRGIPNNYQIRCPNTDCSARYNKKWLFHSQLNPNGYRWCGRCKAELRWPKEKSTYSVDHGNLDRRQNERELQCVKTSEQLELTIGCERNGPEGNWASSTPE